MNRNLPGSPGFLLGFQVTYPPWSQLPYPGEASPPSNFEHGEPFNPSWPLVFLKRDENNWFTDPAGNPLPQVKHPTTIDWDSELKLVQKTLKNLTTKQKALAEYWGTRHVTKQWTPIMDRLIDIYATLQIPFPLVSSSAPGDGRILVLIPGAINDALIVCSTVKYRYKVARPNQLGHPLLTFLSTPRQPSYISGHSTIAGMLAELLSCFFPAKRNQLQKLAEECASSRVYGGVHFPIDSSEGLRIGRAIGRSLASYFSKQLDAIDKSG
ncbi:phosphatase PAP2 family protein [Domibacillus tundrae]|uniref:phosphatase PAP2 family protein n=1 Tax=Domibacillus tundrae TaxID=1587527 RepID=UPI0006968DFD|nr:phosphatase PAP2 family protein [Domibacillus tundrae]